MRARKIDIFKKAEIQDYCLFLMEQISKQYLEENGIYANEFLEHLYYYSTTRYMQEGKHSLSQNDISILVLTRKQMDGILDELTSEAASFIGIQKNENLVFAWKDEESFNKYNKLI